MFILISAGGYQNSKQNQKFVLHIFISCETLKTTRQPFNTSEVDSQMSIFRISDASIFCANIRLVFYVARLNDILFS